MNLEQSNPKPKSMLIRKVTRLELNNVRAILKALSLAYDIPKYWPLTQPKMVATGRLRNIGTNTCARQRGMLSNGDPVGMADCATAGKVRVKDILFSLLDLF